MVLEKQRQMLTTEKSIFKRSWQHNIQISSSQFSLSLPRHYSRSSFHTNTPSWFKILMVATCKHQQSDTNYACAENMVHLIALYFSNLLDIYEKTNIFLCFNVHSIHFGYFFHRIFLYELI